MRRVHPVTAIARGLVAGLVGTWVQAKFFRYTARLAPPPPEGVFTPPEPEQAREPPTATVARRFVEGMLERDFPDSAAERSGVIVQYAYGALWGGLYGVARESYRGLDGALGALGLGAVVWAATYGGVLPGFRLGPWPHKLPAKSHAYNLAAEEVYGAGVVGAYALQANIPWSAALQVYLLRREVSSWSTSVVDAIRSPVAKLGPLVMAARKPLARAIEQLGA